MLSKNAFIPSFTAGNDMSATNTNKSNFLSSNHSFQKSFKDGDKKSPPLRKAAIVTCMDARFHVEPALGLSIGDAHVIRNAGGRVSEDALRSLAISERLLGTNEIYVIHHSDCGMMTFDNAHMCKVLKEQLGDAAESTGKKIEWGTFKSLEGSVRDDLEVLKKSPLIPKDVVTHGFIYDVSNGGLTEVKEDINDRVSNLDINNTAKPTTPEMTDLPPLKQK